MQVKKQNTFKFFLWPTLSLVLVVGAVIFTQAIFNANYYSNFYVSGESMLPTLKGDPKDADYGKYDGHKSALRNVKRFQIVTTHYPSERGLKEEKTIKIKRLLFKPGDTFEVSYVKNDKGEYVNEMHLFLPSGDYRILDYPFDSSSIVGDHSYPKTTLSSTQYFVAGDNWNNSLDSFDESVGPLEFSDLVGVVTKVEGRCKVVNKQITDKKPYEVKIFNGVDY